MKKVYFALFFTGELSDLVWPSSDELKDISLKRLVKYGFYISDPFKTRRSVSSFVKDDVFRRAISYDFENMTYKYE